MKKAIGWIGFSILCGLSFVSSAQISPEQRAIDVAKQYVLKTLKWKCGEFIIQPDDFILEESDSTYIVLRATHEDDHRTTIPGGGKSVQIHVDKSSMEIVKVLGYQ